ncbi:DUF6400 family protein [Streptomyces erythrochromogenes]|uniref:DUF6400 family protein n=1 Tax=Streptomyces erythrochromogenes TaxID=285574 RepID=UPI0037015FC3|nr:DUF6400 family protein [Streptomyces erythrochromogenes]
MTPHTPSPDDHTTGAGAAGTGGGASAGLAEFTLDLTSQEVLRRAQMIEALGPHWNPIEVLHGEEAAHDLLYSGLDPQQQHLYDSLVTAGILPHRNHGHAAP